MQAGVRATMFVVLVVAFVVVSGCSDTETVPLAGIIPTPIAAPVAVGVSGSSQGVGGGGGVGGNGSLYVVDPLQAAVFRFNASDAGADVAPGAIIQGAATQLNSPTQLAFDTNRNRLYVLDTFRVLVFDNPRVLTGNAAPARIFNSTTNGEISIALDEARDILYLGHGAGIGVTSYDNATNLTGAVAPSRTIGGPLTLLGVPLGLLVDASNRIFVGDLNATAVLTFDNANSAQGNIAPTRAIQGANTGFLTPFGVAFDRAGSLFVTDVTADTVSVFLGGANVTGNVAPNFVRPANETSLLDPRQTVCEDGTTLIVADGVDGAVKTFLTEGLTNGVAAPLRVIRAGTAGLGIPTGVAHDPNR